MGKNTVAAFVIDQWTPLGPPFTANLDGKTVVVIGASGGIGFEAAKHFARMKPTRLILGCRSESRGQAALEDIARDTSYIAELQLVDLEDFSSVIALAARLKDSPIDILVANAGIGTVKYEMTKDGWETQLQTNYLSTALLSLLFIPNLIRAGEEKNTTSRLVIVTSSLHMDVRFSEELMSAPNFLKKLNSPEFCTPKAMYKIYHMTKLLEVFFTRALADRLPFAAPLLPTCVDPCYCRSQLRRSVPMGVAIGFKIMDILLGRSNEEGSRNLLYAALGPDGKEGAHQRIIRGAYVAMVSVREPGDYVISKEGYELQKRLWKETIEILEMAAPTVHSIVERYLR